jgi:Mechanosensitive ion channel
MKKMAKSIIQLVLCLFAILQKNQSVLSLPFQPKKPPSSSSDSASAVTAAAAATAATTADVTSRAAAAATTAAMSTALTVTTALIQAELLKRAPGLALAGFLSFGLDPLVQELFNVTHLTWNKGSYQSTFLYATADSMACGAKVYGSLQLLDWLLAVFPKQLRPYCPIQADLTVVAPQVGITLWAARSISKMKNLLIKKAVYGTRYGKVAVLDRVLDYSIVIAAGYNIVHQLQINMGLGLRSLFAASGASAIVLSLASKGMIEQLVAGLLLQAWDAIEEGGTCLLLCYRYHS